MIELKNVHVKVGDFNLQQINLTVSKGEYTVILGPTGAGKTLLLETIAGLHNLKSGEIWIDGRNITRLEPEKRNIGMVYQDSSLFPHLSVADNIVFGLKVRRMPASDIKKKLDEIAVLIGVRHLLDRKPGKLSGAEKQKVAMARALAIKPQLLLLDEPLSALDPETREALQRELKRIQKELNITVVHVTHDFDEAMLMGKHIAVISEGILRQVGTTEEVFSKPDSEFVAHFTMIRNIFSGNLFKQSENLSAFRTGKLELIINTDKIGATHACIRPDDITISPDISSQAGTNCFIGIIDRIEDRGMTFHVFVNVSLEVCCLVTRRQFNEMRLIVDQKVKITFNQDAIHVF